MRKWQTRLSQAYRSVDALKDVLGLEGEELRALKDIEEKYYLH